MKELIIGVVAIVIVVWFLGSTDFLERISATQRPFETDTETQYAGAGAGTSLSAPADYESSRQNKTQTSYVQAQYQYQQPYGGYQTNYPTYQDPYQNYYQPQTEVAPEANESYLRASRTSGFAPLTTIIYTSVPPGTSYRYVLDYGDGMVEDVDYCPVRNGSCVSPGQNEHTFTSARAYTVRLMRIGSSGTALMVSLALEATAQKEVTAGNFSASPYSGTAPLTVSFTGVASGGSYTLSYGDDSPSNGASCGGCSELRVRETHTYTRVGEYTATLRDADGYHTLNILVQ